MISHVWLHPIFIITCEAVKADNVMYYHYTIMWVCAKSPQSCRTLCDSMECGPPGSSVRMILQARILEQVAMPSSGYLPDPGIKPASLYLTGVFLGSPLCSNMTYLIGWRGISVTSILSQRKLEFSEVTRLACVYIVSVRTRIQARPSALCLVGFGCICNAKVK